MAFDLQAAVKIIFGVTGTPAVKQAAEDVRKLGDSADDMGAKASRGAAGLDRVSQESDVAARGLSVLRGVVYGVVAAFGAGAAASIAFARSGIAYNEFLETARLGIASLITAQTALSDASGRPLRGMEALTAATVLAEDQMTKLRIAGLETAATTQQLADAFQQAVGAGLSAGLNLDQIRQITVRVTQAAGALGVPMHQIAQEVRTILDGTIDQNARVAKALQIGPDMVRSWREQGRLAEELQKRLESFATAGSEVARTWTAVKSNMEEARDTFAGEVTAGMFEKLKESGQRALSGMFDTSNATIAPQFQALASVLTDIFDRVGAGLGGAIEWVVAQARELSKWLSENKSIADDLVNSSATIGRQLLDVAGAAGSIVKFVVQWAAESGVVSEVLRMISLLIAGMQDGVKLLGAAFAYVGGLIIEVLFKPLESWLRVMGTAANFVREGWGDSFLKTANDGRDIYQSAYASAAKVIGEFRNGQTAVAQLRREWEQFDGAIDKTKKKSTGGTGRPNYTGRPGAPGEASKADQGIVEAIARLGADAAAQDFEERFGKSPAVQRYFKAISEIQPGGRFAGASDRLKQQFAGAATQKFQGEADDEQAKRELDAWKKQQEDVRRQNEELARAQRQMDEERVRDWSALQNDMRLRTRDANIDIIQDDRVRAQAQLAIAADEFRQRIDLLKPNVAERQNLEREYNDWLVAEQALLAERFKPEWRKLVDAWSDTTRLMRESFDEFVLKGLKAGEDAWVEFAKTGKINVRSLVDMVIAEQARLAYRQNIAPVVSKGLTSIGETLFGGVGTPGSANFVGPLQPGTSSGGGLGGLVSSAASWLVSLFHEGGMAYAPRMARAVDPSVFQGARRMHGGSGPPLLRSGEVPAILDSRESVFTPEQLANLQLKGSSAPVVFNNYQTVNVMPGANRSTANQAALQMKTQTEDVVSRLGAR